MTSNTTQVEKLVDEVRALMDDPSGSLSPVLRRTSRIASLVGDTEHRGLFQLHLEGVIYSDAASPRYNPRQDPNWKPRWDVLKAVMDDRAMSDEKVMALPLEELEHDHRRIRETGVDARVRGHTKAEIELLDLEIVSEKVLFRIRRRVDTFLQLFDDWLLRQEKAAAENLPTHPLGAAIFIGHGRSSAWRDLKDFLSDRLGLPCVEFNSDSAVGKTTIQRLSEMLDASCFAFLVMTAEDQHVDSTVHARENVIHEVGLFQGRLGFTRAVVMLEEGCFAFSNIFGLTHISYPPGQILSKSEEVRRVLEREKLI